MKKIMLICLFLISSVIFAHAPLLSVDDNKDGTIYIEAGFSNGEKADGMELIIVKDKAYNGPEDTYEGNCPFHKDCLEGMAAGPAIEKRWGKKGQELADNEKVWDMEAYYLAQALMKYVLILSPQRIIMGGGVMKQQHLFPRIRKYVQEFLNGYVQKKEILEKIDEYVVYPGLGDEAGFVGSIALGKLALDTK